MPRIAPPPLGRDSGGAVGMADAEPGPDLDRAGPSVKGTLIAVVGDRWLVVVF
jgi:hypothetical protein